MEATNLPFVIPSVSEGSTALLRSPPKQHVNTASGQRFLYCGMTNSLSGELQSIRQGLFPRIDCCLLVRELVWYEHYGRRKSGGTRAKKIRLIEEQNPSWSDLSEARRER